MIEGVETGIDLETTCARREAPEQCEKFVVVALRIDLCPTKKMCRIKGGGPRPRL